MRYSFLIILTLFIPKLSWAQFCGYNMNISNAILLIEDDEQVIQRDLSLYRSLGNSGQCRNYRIFFSKGYSNSYQRKAFSLFGRTLKYNLHAQINKAGILKEINDALNASERLEGATLDRNIYYQNRFFVSLPGNEEQSFPPAGYYFDTIQVALYAQQGSSSTFTFDTTENFTLTFVVPRRLVVSLIDEGATFDPDSTAKVLDFGNLTQPQEKGVDLRVQSNTSYQVRISSLNSGSLKHTSGAAVPYTLKINNSPIGLGTNSSIKIGSGGLTSAVGDRYNFRVQVNAAASDLPSGLYQDSIIITAIAN